MNVGNRFSPVINPMINPMISNYSRPPMFVNMQPIHMHAAPIGYLNQSWPAATSTELWNNQRLPTSNWAPALPISSVTQSQGPPFTLNMVQDSPRQPVSWPTTNHSKEISTLNNTQTNESK